MKFTNLFSPVHLDSDPTYGSDGQIYFNTVDNKYRVFYNDQWNTLLDEYSYPAVERFNVGDLNTASVNTTITDLFLYHIIVAYSASVNYISIDTTANDTFPLGAFFDVVRGGPGQVIFVAEDGVTIRESSPIYLTSTWQSARMEKIGSNEWVLDTNFPDIY